MLSAAPVICFKVLALLPIYCSVANDGSLVILPAEVAELFCSALAEEVSDDIE